MRNKLRTLNIVRQSGLGLCALLIEGINLVWAQQPTCQFLPGSLAEFNLEECRPAPVRPEERAAALASLPSEEKIQILNDAERRKLGAVGAVLHLQQRQEVYAAKVIDVPQAFTGLHERAVLLISRKAIQLLKPEELQALVAHEIGHEYVWNEYCSAKARNDQAQLQELELICDRIAIATLKQMNVPATALITALEKVVAYNREHFGVAINESTYPSLKVRRDNIMRISDAIPTKTSGTTRITFSLKQFIVTLDLSFLPTFRGSPLGFTRVASNAPDLCVASDSHATEKCPEHFVGAVAVAAYSVRLLNGHRPRSFTLRERVTTVDQHPDSPKRAVFERSARAVKGMVTDIQAFGYDEGAIPVSQRSQGREDAENEWRAYRQELYANDEKTPFAVIEWRHTIRSITLMRADAVAPAVRIR